MAADITLLLWGVLAVTVVSLGSLVGGVIIPCTSGKSRRLGMHFFIAMAVGTLSSDAMLHLLPEALGLHSHDHHVEPHNETQLTNETFVHDGSGHGGHDHEAHDHKAHDHKAHDHEAHDHEAHDHEAHDHEAHDHEAHDHAHEGDHDDDHHRIRRHTHHEHGAEALNEHRVLMLKLLCLLGAVYALYLIEFVTYFRSDGGHSHGSSDASPQVEVKAMGPWDAENACVSSSSTSVVPLTPNPISPLISAPPILCGLRGPALIILLGDGVHNFIDGIAIGVGFATSLPAGLANSIAVLCHELPHELGDMAVLLETGLSLTKALVLNLLSALTAFIGLFVGFYAVQMDSAKPWLLAVTAGMFLYVAWIDMLSHLKHEAAERMDAWWLVFALQCAGLLFGTVLMLVLGWYEHELFH